MDKTIITISDAMLAWTLLQISAIIISDAKQSSYHCQWW